MDKKEKPIKPNNDGNKKNKKKDKSNVHQPGPVRKKEPINSGPFKKDVEEFLNYINDRIKQVQVYKKKTDITIKTLTLKKQAKILLDFNEVLLTQIVLLNSLIQVLITKGVLTGIELGLMTEMNSKKLKEFIDHLKINGNENPFGF